MIFTTTLSSSNFAVNAAEGRADHLAALFPGMSVATADRVLRSPGVCRRPAANQIEVPDHMCSAEDRGLSPSP